MKPRSFLLYLIAYFYIWLKNTKPSNFFIAVLPKNLRDVDFCKLDFVLKKRPKMPNQVNPNAFIISLVLLNREMPLVLNYVPYIFKIINECAFGCLSICNVLPLLKPVWFYLKIMWIIIKFNDIIEKSISQSKSKL